MATFRADDSDPKEQFVYHAPGNDGSGSAGYIDDVILRDKDADTDWDVASDGTLEERFYYCQNWRHDVVAVIEATGGGTEQLEHPRYEAYGMPFLILAGDVDASGSVTLSDLNTIQGWIDTSTYDVRGDMDLDGDVDATDKTLASKPKVGGRGRLGGLTGNRKGYAGYEFDDTIAHESYHVRHRVLNSVLGQWGRRDPLGYVDGTALYEYARLNPIVGTDPRGLTCKVTFECCHIGTVWDDPGDFDDGKTCVYSCVETRRETTGSGVVVCEPTPGGYAVPSGPLVFVNRKKEEGCAPCRGCHSYSLLFASTTFDRNCDKQDCYNACDDGEDMAEWICKGLKGGYKAACKVLVEMAESTCYELCDTFCAREFNSVSTNTTIH